MPLVLEDSPNQTIDNPRFYGEFDDKHPIKKLFFRQPNLLKSSEGTNVYSHPPNC